MEKIYDFSCSFAKFRAVEISWVIMESIGDIVWVSKELFLDVSAIFPEVEVFLEDLLELLMLWGDVLVVPYLD